MSLTPCLQHYLKKPLTTAHVVATATNLGVSPLIANNSSTFKFIFQGWYLPVWEADLCQSKILVFVVFMAPPSICQLSEEW